jgi:hypothetical protein
MKALNVPWTLKQSGHRDSSQSLQYLTATEDVVVLKQGSQSCDEEAISFLKLNAKVSNRALYVSLRQSRGFLVINILSYRSYCLRLAILKNCSFGIKQQSITHSFTLE